MRAGAVTPATRGSVRRGGWGRGCALNEGRGCNPGDTRPTGRDQLVRLMALNEGRGCNPGDTEERPALAAALTERSMRAGAVTPATPPVMPWTSTVRVPLNEGRGCNPGDTSAHLTSSGMSSGAQ